MPGFDCHGLGQRLAEAGVTNSGVRNGRYTGKIIGAIPVGIVDVKHQVCAELPRPLAISPLRTIFNQ